LFITTVPVVNQSINQNCHGIDFRSQSILFSSIGQSDFEKNRSTLNQKNTAISWNVCQIKTP